MPFSQNQLTVLKSFLDGDPGTYGALSDQDAAVTLNTPSVVRIKASLSGQEVYSVTDGTEFGGLSDAQKAQWLALCAITSVNPANGTPAHTLATDLFPGAGATLTALAALRQETVSPATDQGLPRVRANDVNLARAL